ncbi:hypothetical protein PFISCL1PPCAC_12644, partial [Pristionchus fissidentatus]
SGDRKMLTHYLERNENLTPVQIVDRKGEENIFFREFITAADMDSWDRHTELATRSDQDNSHAYSLSLAPRLFSRSWRLMSNRSDDSGISDGGRSTKSLPCQWESRSC